jgi:hypothetical protein
MEQGLKETEEKPTQKAAPKKAKSQLGKKGDPRAVGTKTGERSN